MCENHWAAWTRALLFHGEILGRLVALGFFSCFPVVTLAFPFLVVLAGGSFELGVHMIPGASCLRPCCCGWDIVGFIFLMFATYVAAWHEHFRCRLFPCLC